MYNLITPELLEAHRQDLIDMASPTRRGHHDDPASSHRSVIARAFARLAR